MSFCKKKRPLFIEVKPCCSSTNLGKVLAVFVLLKPNWSKDCCCVSTDPVVLFSDIFPCSDPS